jgi:hypothetical protein
MAKENHDSEAWAERALQHSPCRINAVMAHPSKMPGLSLEVSDRSIPKGVRLPTGKGFVVTRSRVGSGPGLKVRIILELNDSRHADVFSALVEDVLAAATKAPDEAHAVKAFVGRLEAWQVFMQHHAEGLSLEQQSGLFAELSVLGLLLDQIGPGSGVVQAWVGPTRALHDFDFGPCHLEVKSGVDRFHVSIMAQLDESVLEHLILCHCVVIASNAGTSLPDIVDAARTRLANEQMALTLFNDRLHAAGYSDAHRKQYEDRKLIIREMRFFRVQDGFPRILAFSVPPGVTTLEYQVDIRACAPFEISQQAAFAYMSPSKAEP